MGVNLPAVPMISGRDGHSDPIACVNSLSLRASKLGSAAAAPCPRRSHVDAAEPQEDVQRLRKSWTRCHFRFSISVALERSNHAGLCEVRAIVPRKHAFHTLVHCSRNEGLGQTVEIAMRPARAIDGNCRLDLAAVRFLCLEDVGYGRNGECTARSPIYPGLFYRFAARSEGKTERSFCCLWSTAPKYPVHICR